MKLKGFLRRRYSASVLLNFWNLRNNKILFHETMCLKHMTWINEDMSVTFVRDNGRDWSYLTKSATVLLMSIDVRRWSTSRVMLIRSLEILLGFMLFVLQGLLRINSPESVCTSLFQTDLLEHQHPLFSFINYTFHLSLSEKFSWQN